VTPPGLPDPTTVAAGLALVVCLANGLTVFLDVPVVNAVLPTISSQLHTSGSCLQDCLLRWALAFCLLLFPSGMARRPIGHWMFLLAGLAVAASAACGAEHSATVLVSGRIVQSTAGAVLTP